ncbi:MAG: SPOR domain-containing protein [Magnetococcales bacterium]|nr:SPOR domain-containing protein [Magnetococcales bacterium]
MNIGASLVGGRYRLQGVLRQDPFSTIYKASEEGSRESVVLQTIPGEIARDLQAFGEYKRLFHRLRALALPGVGLPEKHLFDPQSQSHLLAGFYRPGIDLTTWRKKFDGGVAPVVLAWQLCGAVAKRLVQPHGLPSPFPHGLLRPDTILVEEGGEVRLEGFGLAYETLSLVARFSASGLSASQSASLAVYLAPERFLLRTPFANNASPAQLAPRIGGFRFLPAPPTPSSDIFSLGVIFYELVTGQVPFTEGQLAATAAGEALPAVSLPAELEEGLRRFLQRSLDADPLRRPTAGAWATLATERGERREKVQLRQEVKPVAAETPELVYGPAGSIPLPEAAPAEAVEPLSSPPVEESSPPTPLVETPPHAVRAAAVATPRERKRLSRSHKTHRPELTWLVSGAAGLAAVGVLLWKVFVPGVAEEQGTAQVRRLLESAQRDLAALELSSDSGRQAREKFVKVLRLDPANDGAREGMAQVVKQYASLATSAIGVLSDLAAERREFSAPADGRISDERYQELTLEIAREKRRAADLEAQVARLEAGQKRGPETENRLKEAATALGTMAALEEKLRQAEAELQRLRGKEPDKTRLAALPKTPPGITPPAKTIPEPLPVPSAEPYAVQVGAYLESDKVDLVIKQLSKVTVDGKPLPVFQETATVSGKRYIRVRVGPFPGRDGASAARSRVQEQTGMDGILLRHKAW